MARRLLMSNPSNGDHKRLSVAMILRDAEDVVAESLASVAAIADEIVVADTGSRDNTLAIVKPIATRLIEVPWQEDFSAARNACLQATTGQWVLWLDAGE
ncbi:MAG: glycosyltransferase, partial [Chloroflexi bacterium]|nr:glycosyltransferase [Chloroflexota bacterium]